MWPDLVPEQVLQERKPDNIIVQNAEKIKRDLLVNNIDEQNAYS